MMKRFVFTICLAVTAVLALHAQGLYRGEIVINSNGQIYTQTASILDVFYTTGFHSFELVTTFMGDDLRLDLEDVLSAQSDGITTFSTEQDATTTLGTMHTIMFARATDGMMVVDFTFPTQNITMRFNSVGDHFQLPNGNLEAWTASTGEPDRWHGFKSAGGSYATTSASLVKLAKSNDVREGATGYSAVMTANSIIGIVANGTMTNGRLMAGAMSAASYDNHAEMDKSSTETDANGDLFYMPLYAKPDKFNVWLKYTQGTTNNNFKASVSVKTFDGTYYQEPDDDVYTNISGSIVGGQIPAGGWTHYSFPFDYDSYAANGAASEAIFVTFSTNGTPGQGYKNDALYVDDMELVYLGNMTDLRYQGVTINGWNPAVTTYNMEMAAEPNLDDFTATIEGVSAVVTKTMEQNQDGTYRIAISVVAADLQTASCYIINVSVPQGLIGDVDDSGKVEISDVTALIDYLLNGSGASINTHNADVDYSGKVEISDVTILIDLLLSGN